MSDTCGRCGRRLKDPFFREVGWRDVDRAVADALDILKGGKAE